MYSVNQTVRVNSLDAKTWEYGWAQTGKIVKPTKRTQPPAGWFLVKLDGETYRGKPVVFCIHHSQIMASNA